MNTSLRISALLLAGALATAASGADVEYRLTLREHRFEPAEIQVPVGQKVKLVIHNRDATPEEFESHELNREKVIPGGATVGIYIGPLAPGRYPFFGEFNEATARGTIVAR